MNLRRFITPLLAVLALVVTPALAADTSISGLSPLVGPLAPSDPIVTVHAGHTVRVPVSALMLPSNVAPTTQADATFGGTVMIRFPNGISSSLITSSGYVSGAVFGFTNNGPTFTYGAVAPVIPAVIGSVYLRTDVPGLYQYTSSGWLPVVNSSVASVSATSPIVSTGGSNPTISLANPLVLTTGGIMFGTSGSGTASANLIRYGTTTPGGQVAISAGGTRTANGIANVVFGLHDTASASTAAGLAVDGSFNLGIIGAFYGQGTGLTAIPAATALTGQVPTANGGTGASAFTAASCVRSVTAPALASAGGDCVTSVAATAPLASSGGVTPTISLTGSIGTSTGGTGSTSYTTTRCLRTATATTFASAAGDCVTAVTASGNIASTGGTTPALSLTGTIPTNNGGTGAAAYTSGACLRTATATAFASASGDCVTSVGGTGNVASTGGTNPILSLTGLVPIANGGTNAGSLTANRCLRFDGTSIAVAAADCTFGTVTGVTAASSNIVVAGSAAAPTIDLAASPGVNALAFTAAGTPSTTQPTLTQDGGTVPGFLSTVPSTATNGWTWRTNNAGALTTRMTLSPAGALSPQSLTPATALGTAFGGTGAASYTAATCVRASTATLLASAAGDCVTSVAATGVRASPGGTTPSISLTGTVPIASGGTNATALTTNRCLRFDGTSVVSAAQDCTAGTVTSVTTSGSFLTTTGTAAAPVVGVNGVLDLGHGGTGNGAMTVGQCVHVVAGPFLASSGADCGTGTVTGVTATAPVASSGGAAPVISLGTVGFANGGTGATSFTNGTCVRVATAVFASANGDCVTAVSGSGNIASTGGTTPSLSITGTIGTANGGTGASSYTSGTCIRAVSATVFGSAAADCVTSVTAGSTNITVGGTATAPTIDLSASHNATTISFNGDGSPGNANPALTGDGGTIRGLLSTVAATSTNGWSWKSITGGVQTLRMNLSAGGILSGMTLQPASAIGTAFGGTGATSFTSGQCVRTVSATVFASAAGDCVTSVTATGVLTSSGGTTPQISLTGTVPIANGGTNATSFTTNTCLRFNGTSIVSASGDCLSGTIGIANGGTGSTSFTANTCIRYNGTALVSAGADCGSGGGATAFPPTILQHVGNGFSAGISVAATTGTIATQAWDITRQSSGSILVAGISYSLPSGVASQAFTVSTGWTYYGSSTTGTAATDCVDIYTRTPDGSSNDTPTWTNAQGAAITASVNAMEVNGATTSLYGIASHLNGNTVATSHTPQLSATANSLVVAIEPGTTSTADGFVIGSGSGASYPGFGFLILPVYNARAAGLSYGGTTGNTRTYGIFGIPHN